MKLNRDLTILATMVFIKQKSGINKINILDGFAATGIRGLRLIKEIDQNVDYRFRIGCIDSNDIIGRELIELNYKENGINEERFRIFESSVDSHLKQNNDFYDMIDVDPYGSFAPYLKQSIINIRLGGLLCLSATDLSVLDGQYHKYLIKEHQHILTSVEDYMEVIEYLDSCIVKKVESEYQSMQSVSKPNRMEDK